VERDIQTGDTRFTAAGATALFRIEQEALTNVAKHAEATLATLSLRLEHESFVLRIADNGQGAHCAAKRAGKSFGLLGIRERMHMLGGVVEFQTACGKGFALTAEIPAHTVQMQEIQT
jgi:two-component system sensor kinase